MPNSPSCASRRWSSDRLVRLLLRLPEGGRPFPFVGIFHALLGIGLVSGGTAALNEVMEHDIDGHMRRTAQRPLPTGRMSFVHADARGPGDDSRRRALSRLYAESADRHARPPYRVRVPGRLHSAEEGSSRLHFRGRIPRRNARSAGVDRRPRPAWSGKHWLMFAIVFFWQFPHFFSIAWLYREDYAAGQIRMLPVVEPDGKSTALRILVYSLASDSGQPGPDFPGHVRAAIYLVGALLLVLALLYVGSRLATLHDATQRRPLQTARPAVTAGHRPLSPAPVHSHDDEPGLVVE